jgi:hypothetical protein
MSTLADPGAALHWVTCLAGLAVFISSLELLSLRREFLAGGFYHWDEELAGDPLLPLLPLALWKKLRQYPVFYWIVILRLVLATFLLFDVPLGSARAPLMFSLVAISLFIGARLEYGLSGADPMIGIVLCGLGFAGLAPHSIPVHRTAVWFIALQTTFAYSAAGITKMFIPAWRDGTYLSTSLRSSIYGHPLAASALSNPLVSLTMSWMVILWECTFSLAFLFGEPGAMFYCAIGLLLHAGIAVFMGLKLFLFIFAATYPAVIACALQVQRFRA